MYAESSAKHNTASAAGIHAHLTSVAVDRPPDSISIEEFGRVDLRVATILSAEAHPRADRLLVLRIDLGDEQRQIVAGIRQDYRPEDLAGKQIVVAANLTPVVLRGVESQGFLVAK